MEKAASCGFYEKGIHLWQQMNQVPQHFTREKGYWSNPSGEKNTGLFTRLTDLKSQREDWYKVSSYIAEFWCTVSNLGFLLVGIQYRSPEILFAGCASTLSHAIPRQWLLIIDKIGVLLVIAKVIREHQLILAHPWLLAPLALAGAINVVDTYLARVDGKTWPHVMWHLSSAFLAGIVLHVIRN